MGGQCNERDIERSMVNHTGRMLPKGLGDRGIVQQRCPHHQSGHLVAVERLPPEFVVADVCTPIIRVDLEIADNKFT